MKSLAELSFRRNGVENSFYSRDKRTLNVANISYQHGNLTIQLNLPIKNIHDLPPNRFNSWKHVTNKSTNKKHHRRQLECCVSFARFAIDNVSTIECVNEFGFLNSNLPLKFNTKCHFSASLNRIFTQICIS